MTTLEKAYDVLKQAMGEAVEGCDIVEASHLIVSQRDNARNEAEHYKTVSISLLCVSYDLVKEVMLYCKGDLHKQQLEHIVSLLKNQTHLLPEKFKTKFLSENPST